MRACQRALTYAARLRDALATVGLSAEEFPDLGATVSADGEPTILIGQVEAETAIRFAELLDGLPPPRDAHGSKVSNGSERTRCPMARGGEGYQPAVLGIFLPLRTPGRA